MADLWGQFDAAEALAKPKAREPLWVKTYKTRLICKECLEDPANLIEDYSSGDLICGSCGLVLGEHAVDMRPEWRTFTGDDDDGPDPNRCGDAASHLLDGAQLNTSIDYVPGVAGRELARAQGRTKQGTTNKALLAAYSEISAYCESMRLTTTVSDASKEYYKKAYDSKAVRSRDKVTVIASCIFLACRRCQVPRTFNEVMSITKKPKKDISRTFKILSKLFQKEEAEKAAAAPAKSESKDAESPPMSPTSGPSYGTAVSMVPRVCTHLELGYKCQRIATELAAEVQRLETLGGRGPATIAAAVVYMAAHINQKPRTFKGISDVTGVTANTIKAAYKLLYKKKTQLVDPEWVLDGITYLPEP